MLYNPTPYKLANKFNVAPGEGDVKMGDSRDESTVVEGTGDEPVVEDEVGLDEIEFFEDETSQIALSASDEGYSLPMHDTDGAEPVAQQPSEQTDVAGTALDPQDSDDPEVYTELIDGINPSKIPFTTWIRVVLLGRGCSTGCVHCGAFQGAKVEKITTVSKEKFREYLEQEIIDTQTGVRMRLIDLFASYVTTGVDMEPLDPGIAVEAAEIIYELSGKPGDKPSERSRLIFISHGGKIHNVNRQRKVVPGANPLADSQSHLAPKWELFPHHKKRLARVNKLMLDDVIPAFVLTTDSARSEGLYGVNAESLLGELRDFEASDEYKIIADPNPDIGLIAHIARGWQIDDGKWLKDTPAEWKARLRKAKEGLIDHVKCDITRLKKEGAVTDAEVEAGLNEKERVLKKYIDKRDAFRNSVIEMNARSYALTLIELMDAIRAGKKVTISIQGDKDPDGLVYYGLATVIWQRTSNILQEEYGISSTDIGKINVLQEPRSYVDVGRAHDNKLELDPGYECPVIPDPELDDLVYRADQYRINRGMVTTKGHLLVQIDRRRHGYRDLVASTKGIEGDPVPPNPWKKVILATKGDDYARALGTPTEFLDKMSCLSNPRVVRVPDDCPDSVVGEVNMHQVYPFNLIPREADARYLAVIAQVQTYLEKQGVPGAEIDITKLPLTSQQLRELVIQLLIPDSTVELHRGSLGPGRSSQDCRELLANEVIRLYSPTLEVIGQYATEEEAASDAREMASILVLQRMLKEFAGIEVKLADEKVYASRGPVTPDEGVDPQEDPSSTLWRDLDEGGDDDE